MTAKEIIHCLMTRRDGISVKAAKLIEMQQFEIDALQKEKLRVSQILNMANTV